ncbi:nucleotide sugar dehydrogenase [Salinirubellus salinus]
MICVHGLGYVGLATASLFANAGHEVVGYDPSDCVRAALEARRPRVTEPELREFVCRALDAEEEGRLTVSDTPVAADFHLVCVPTPFDESTGHADLRFVDSAARNVGRVLRAGDVVVLESTVPPGTTEGTFRETLEAESGLVAGTDFGLAFTPETVLPGNTVAELRTNARIVGGIDAGSREAVRALYGTAIEAERLSAPDCTTAEFVKLAQNASRDVQIAFANEMARIAGDYGVDARAAIGLANHHPRVNILSPGPGVGGHCLPVDPHFLKEASDSVHLVETARRVNDSMPEYVIELLEGTVGSLEGKTVAVLGVAYKGNVDDARNSPGLAIADLLGVALPEGIELHGRAMTLASDGGGTVTHGEGVTVRLTDPYVTDDSLDLVPLTAALDGADAAILASPHAEYADLDPARVAALGPDVVVDPFGILVPERWAEAGIEVVTY